MATRPTEPLRPDDDPTAVVSEPRRCTAGHDQPHNPTWHPTLGLVPALTSVIFALVLVAVILALEAWIAPVLLSWTVGLLLIALVASALVQALLGHRGMCWLWRTLRWWLGPIGALVDPVEMG